MKSKNKKETRGGKRPFSGRKKADYETKTIAFRVRVEFVEPIKKMVKDYVSERLKGDAKRYAANKSACCLLGAVSTSTD
jgi:hypothetical protein